jgi:uncharacterized protein
MDHIDPMSRAIIEKSPFIVMASATPDGYPDISSKGDPAGFVKVLDERYLAIPDRPGNRRVDTFRNILKNPYLAILFLIPGKGETLRVTGETRTVCDRPLRESMAVDGRVPEFAIVMHGGACSDPVPKVRIESEAVAAGAVAGYLEYGGYRGGHDRRTPSSTRRRKNWRH